jgi:NAD(P)-dependent dehydrogenase (short-subunit alcohol dehydrogenase family)
MGWSEQDIPDLTGKVAVVTGASAGLGLECSRALAARGAHVVMATRDAAKTEAAADRIRDAVPDASLAHTELDLADLASVAKAAAELRDTTERIDILLCNAGLMATPERRTDDGFELQFGVNHLGHAAFVAQTLPRVTATEGSRIVIVSSHMHTIGRIDFDDLMFERRRYDRWLAYGQSKLANLLYMRELQRRLAKASAPTIAVAAHPGYARTELQAKGTSMEGGPVAFLNLAAMQVGNRLLAQSPARGALPLLFAATAKDVEGGKYYGPRGFGGWRGPPGRSGRSREAHSDETAARLWEVTEQLVGVSHELPG